MSQSNHLMHRICAEIENQPDLSNFSEQQHYKHYIQQKALPHISEEYNFRLTNSLLVNKILRPRRDKTIMQSLNSTLWKKDGTKENDKKNKINRRNICNNSIHRCKKIIPKNQKENQFRVVQQHYYNRNVRTSHKNSRLLQPKSSQKYQQLKSESKPKPLIGKICKNIRHSNSQSDFDGFFPIENKSIMVNQRNFNFAEELNYSKLKPKTSQSKRYKNKQIRPNNQMEVILEIRKMIFKKIRELNGETIFCVEAVSSNSPQNRQKHVLSLNELMYSRKPIKFSLNLSKIKEELEIYIYRYKKLDYQILGKFSIDINPFKYHEHIIKEMGKMPQNMTVEKKTNNSKRMKRYVLMDRVDEQLKKDNEQTVSTVECLYRIYSVNFQEDDPNFD